jgi:outer membrane protein OmpA-like peptidoglycan-associated protein
MSLKNELMKKITLIFAVLLSIGSLRAQYVYEYLKAADSYFEKGDHASAAVYYEKYFASGESGNTKQFSPYIPQSASSKKTASENENLEATYRMAESYRMLNFPAKAEPNYRKVMSDRSRFPLAEYYYAMMLRALQKYPEAEQHFRNFLAGHKTGDNFRREAERELKNLDFIKAQLARTDTRYYTLSKATQLNSTGASYAPAWKGSTLLFTSTRPLDSTSKENKYVNRLYEAAFSEGIVSGINLSSIKQENDVHQAIAGVTPDGNTIYLTRWKNKSKEDREVEIYTSSWSGSGWSEPKKIDGDLNVDGADVMEPFITSDGKYLIYSSNRAGGKGGYDLWYAELVNGKPGTSKNMGATINTSYDERAPFYHAASQTLVFSSNGRIGMGGYDFFQSRGSIGSWAEPMNLGHPVNSVRDDIYFTSRGGAKNMLEDVMLSSDRSSDCCLDLFYLKKVRPLKQISGRIVSCDPARPLTAGKVVVVDPATGQQVYTATVAADGSYSFTLEDHLPLKLSAEATGFMPKSLDVALPADIEEERRTWPELCLMPEPQKDETFVIENVYFDFDKADLKPESYPALDEVVRMLNYYPNMEIELSAHTDSKGSDTYNLKLSDARAKSVLDYLVSKGIEASRLTSKGYGESVPVDSNTNPDGTDNPEGRQKNRRTEFKVLKNE